MTESMAIFKPIGATKTMKDAFNEMCSWRLDHFNLEHRTEEYQEAMDRQQEIFKELINLLPTDKKKLLFEFDDITNFMGMLDEDRIYKMGLSDAKELANLF